MASVDDWSWSRPQRRKTLLPQKLVDGMYVSSQSKKHKGAHESMFEPESFHPNTNLPTVGLEDYQSQAPSMQPFVAPTRNHERSELRARTGRQFASEHILQFAASRSCRTGVETTKARIWYTKGLNNNLHSEQSVLCLQHHLHVVEQSALRLADVNFVSGKAICEAAEQSKHSQNTARPSQAGRDITEINAAACAGEMALRYHDVKRQQ